MLSLYEPDATLALPTGFGEGSVTGLDRLRQAFSRFLALNPQLTVNPEKRLVSGDTALVIGHWTLTGRDQGGNKSRMNSSRRPTSVRNRTAASDSSSVTRWRSRTSWSAAIASAVTSTNKHRRQIRGRRPPPARWCLEIPD
jgi:SnoaL-like domain